MSGSQNAVEARAAGRRAAERRLRILVPPLLAVVASLLTVIAGCIRESGPDADPAQPPNVLLVSLDTLRADHLGCYGYARNTSPFLDSLAASGVRFGNAFINALGTTPSHTTILSSRYQETHGMDYERPHPDSIVPIPGDVRMVQEVFDEAGYRTVAVTGGGRIHERYGFDRGFDHYDSRARGIERGVRRLLSTLPERIEEPTFVLFHTYEIHSDYRPPEAYREMFGQFEGSIRPTSEALLELNRPGATPPSAEDVEHLVARYDGGIRYADDTLRELFAELDRRGFFERYLVVVVSDHGEEFGEHGHFLHQGYLYEELLRIPLILTGDRVPAGEVRDELVSTIDLAPTILAYAGLASEPEMVGRDLLDRPHPGRPVFAQYGPRRYAVRTERFKLIENTGRRTLELYDLETDPGEQLNLAENDGATVAKLRDLLDAFKRESAPPPRDATAVPLEPAHLEHLEALGYL